MGGTFDPGFLPPPPAGSYVWSGENLEGREELAAWMVPPIPEVPGPCCPEYLARSSLPGQQPLSSPRCPGSVSVFTASTAYVAPASARWAANEHRIVPVRLAGQEELVSCKELQWKKLLAGRIWCERVLGETRVFASAGDGCECLLGCRERKSTRKGGRRLVAEPSCLIKQIPLGIGLLCFYP